MATTQSWQVRKQRYGPTGAKTPEAFRQRCFETQQQFKGTARPQVAEKLRLRSLAKYNPNFALSSDSLRYLSGILDAEGTIVCRKVYVTSQSYATRVAIYNTDRNVLDVIQRWLNFGNVTGRTYHHSSHFGKKTVFMWSCQTTELARQLLTLLAPYLRVKHGKVEEILRGAYPFAPMAWAYVAGFFDGEGSVVDYSSKNYRCHTHYEICMVQKDRAVLDEIQSFLGYGRVSKHGEDCWMLKIHRHADQTDFMEGVLPYSIVKRRQLEEARRFNDGKDWDAFHKLRRIPDHELSSLYLGGFSIRAIARRYGVTYEPTRTRLLKVGVPLRSSRDGRWGFVAKDV